MKITTKHRVTVTLSVRQYEEICRRSAERGETLAVIIREVVASGLKRKGGK